MRRIGQSFRPVLGLPSWGVENGWGSFLTFEFGQPTLVVREPYVSDAPYKRVRASAAQRLAYPRGEWHLWIYCCGWKVTVGSKVVADWTTHVRSKRAPGILNGQILTGITPLRGGRGWVFDFDLGAKLETRPYDRSSEQWMLFEPNDRVLSVRADKKYSYGIGARTPIQQRWLPIDA